MRPLTILPALIAIAVTFYNATSFSFAQSSEMEGAAAKLGTYVKEVLRKASLEETDENMQKIARVISKGSEMTGIAPIEILSCMANMDDDLFTDIPQSAAACAFMMEAMRDSQPK